MEISVIVLLFFFRVAIVAVPIYFVQLFLLPDTARPQARELQWAVSYGTAFVLCVIDQIYIYPKYRSPYRHLPSVKVGRINLRLFAALTAIRTMGDGSSSNHRAGSHC